MSSKRVSDANETYDNARVSSISISSNISIDSNSAAFELSFPSYFALNSLHFVSIASISRSMFESFGESNLKCRSNSHRGWFVATTTSSSFFRSIICWCWSCRVTFVRIPKLLVKKVFGSPKRWCWCAFFLKFSSSSLRDDSLNTSTIGERRLRLRWWYTREELLLLAKPFKNAAPFFVAEKDRDDDDDDDAFVMREEEKNDICAIKVWRSSK